MTEEKKETLQTEEFSKTYHFETDFEKVVYEIIHLQNLCGISLTQTGVMDAVLKNENTLRNKNPTAFDKLRGLVILAFKLIEQTADFHGGNAAAEALAKTINRINDQIQKVNN